MVAMFATGVVLTATMYLASRFEVKQGCQLRPVATGSGLRADALFITPISFPFLTKPHSTGRSVPQPITNRGSRREYQNGCLNGLRQWFHGTSKMSSMSVNFTSFGQVKRKGIYAHVNGFSKPCRVVSSSLARNSQVNTHLSALGTARTL